MKTISPGESIHSATANSWITRHLTGWVEGCDAILTSEAADGEFATDTPRTVGVYPGTVYVNGSEVSVTKDTITLPERRNPVIFTILVTSSGGLAWDTGPSGELDPNRESISGLGELKFPYPTSQTRYACPVAHVLSLPDEGMLLPQFFEDCRIPYIGSGSGGGSGELPSNPSFETVYADQFNFGGAETKHQPADGRPLNSTENKTVYVDPATGDDTNDGTESAPLATLEEALDRTPIILNHMYIIDLADGTYTSTDPNMAAAHFVGAENHNTPFLIRGNADNPENVVLDLNLALSVGGPELDNPVLQDLHLTGTLLNKDGDFKVENVTFTGTYDRILSGEAISLHESSTTILRNCTFEPAVETAVHLRDMARVHMVGCSGSVSGYATVVSDGAILTEAAGNNVLGELGFYDLTRGGMVFNRQGSPRHARDTLIDDFSDSGTLDARRAPPFGGYCPDWSIQGGTPTLEDDHMRLPAGDTTAQWVRTQYRTVRETTGVWELDFSFESAPTSGQFQFRYISENNSNLTQAMIDSSGIDLVTVDSGTYNTDATLSWTPDTDMHTIRAERSTDIDGSGNAGYRLTFDGTEVGSVTTPFIPTPNYIRLLNNSDAAVQIHYLRMQKESGM